MEQQSQSGSSKRPLKPAGPVDNDFEDQAPEPKRKKSDMSKLSSKKASENLISEKRFNVLVYDLLLKWFPEDPLVKEIKGQVQRFDAKYRKEQEDGVHKEPKHPDSQRQNAIRNYKSCLITNYENYGEKLYTLVQSNKTALAKYDQLLMEYEEKKKKHQTRYEEGVAKLAQGESS